MDCFVFSWGQSSTDAGLCVAAMIPPSAVICVWLNRENMRRTLYSAACLPCSRFWSPVMCSYVQKRLPPIWLTHLTKLEDGVFLRNSAGCQVPWVVLLITSGASSILSPSHVALFCVTHLAVVCAELSLHRIPSCCKSFPSEFHYKHSGGLEKEGSHSVPDTSSKRPWISANAYDLLQIGINI